MKKVISRSIFYVRLFSGGEQSSSANVQRFYSCGRARRNGARHNRDGHSRRSARQFQSPEQRIRDSDDGSRQRDRRSRRRCRLPARKIAPLSIFRRSHQRLRRTHGFQFQRPRSGEFKGNAVKVRAVVRYQACTDEVCYPPKNKEITLTAKVK
jgi:hypothetical protein